MAGALSRNCGAKSASVVPVKSATSADIDRWLTAMNVEAVPDVVPDEWMTVKALAERLRLARPTISQKLLDIESRGLAERKVFRITTGSVTRPVEHWRLTQ